MIGDVPGVRSGTTYRSREELYAAGVHRALQAGIVGSKQTGAESIVLSGGYVDDEDHGDVVIYTGHGGRDQNTGRQIADQQFTLQNKALVVSQLQGTPVRVIRGGRHRGANSPSSGYRYDGLYWVDEHWQSRGQHGFLVCRFRLISAAARSAELTQAPQTTVTRRLSSVMRIVRDTAMSREVKKLHDYRCQVCGTRLEGDAGPYAEGAHIRPLGSPHNGPDTASNVLCLCPNHHVLFDYGAFTIADDLSLLGLPGRLRTARKHLIDIEYLAYRRTMRGA